MTVKQKQWQLYYLGFLPDSGEIDGIWGPKSAAATEAFQRSFGMTADGIFGTRTEEKSREIITALQNAVGNYVPLVSDGLAGPVTMAATAAYQKTMGHTAVGIADREMLSEIPNMQEVPQREDWWTEIRYFSREEFKCKCGGRYCSGYPSEMKREVVRVADRARGHFGRPGHIISGLRCKQHNANSGGAANSQHMYGEAIDLHIEGISADALLSYILQQPEIRYAYKINSGNVHFDIPKGAR